jgi:ankyrin repeat protein
LEIKTKGRKGWTLFHYAAEYQNVSIGKELLSKGADLNAKDDFGNNVLWRAIFSSKVKGEFIQFLIENGADKFAENNSGISPMDLADTIDNYNVKQYL